MEAQSNHRIYAPQFGTVRSVLFAELESIMADENDGISGHVNFAKYIWMGNMKIERFCSRGCENRLWRQHIQGTDRIRL